jgi:acetyltransferase-like isoleucine patch superfamily enzyme
VNATVVNDIEIGKNCIVCGGTFLTKSIADEVCVIGNPYREIDRVYL